MAVKTKNHEFEKIIIKALLTSKDFCKRILSKNFKEDIFDVPIHKFVFKTAKQRYDKSSDLISWDDLKYIVDKNTKDERERGLRNTVLEQLKNEIEASPQQPQRYQFCWEELLRLYQVREFFNTVETGINKISSDPNVDPLSVISDVERLFYKVKRSSNSILVDKEDIFSKESVHKRIERYLDEKDKPINRGLPYFLPRLTEVTGGIKNTDLILFAGRQKSGKSITLLNEAVYLTRLGYNVAYVSIEQSKEEITLRADSLATDLKHFEIKLRKLDEHHETLYQARLSELASFGKFYVIDVPRGCTIPIIEREVRDLLDQGIDIHCIIVDYLGLLHGGSSDDDASRFFFNIGLMTRQMKELCREWKIPILTASQMTRASEKEKVKTGSAIAFNDQVGSHVDAAFGLVPLGEGKMELQTLLIRDAVPVTVPCLTNYERMLIIEQALPSKKDEDEEFEELL